jgi:hypothetical protein
MGVRAAGAFHKRFQIEFSKATRLQKKDLTRLQRNVVYMAIHGPYQILHQSKEKAKYNQTHPLTAEVLSSGRT